MTECYVCRGLPPEQQAIRARCFHPSGTFVDFKKEEIEQSIPDRFEKIVRKYSDRVAVKIRDQVVTYAEFNAMANRVARAILAQRGSQAEPVGLLFEKGVPQIAAMLGVLKAGKFFVPLDPSFPKARIAAVLKDSQADLMVTDRQNISLARDVASSCSGLIELESINRGISPEDLRLTVSPTSLALIFYTSGSTGEPKGVIQNHRNLLHNMMLRTNASHVCAHDRIALLPSGTANAVTNAFFALLSGATLLPFDVQKEGGARLASWLLQEKISICFISSPLFRNLCETLTGEEKFPDLRVLRLRSEAVYRTDVDLYKKHFSSNCILINGLSSTETGPLSEYLIDHNTEIAGSEVPVGYPVEGKEILLLDDTGREIGGNEVGEIAVRSRYLSPGYWRRTDLTKSKFNPDPKGGDNHLYLTGDLGLMLPDGCLVHKGRKDYRVKIRGYGVEIAEVEKALLDHEAVREAVVVARDNELGEARLVAYYTSSSHPRPSVSDLRGFLTKKLPDYMIPSAFVTMDAIPLTPNGKVDRPAFPVPDNSRPKLNSIYVAPRTPREKELVNIWAEVLALDQIGIHDNFFALGGHSLLATRVISRIHENFQVELSLSHFFETPTIVALAGSIERACLPRDGAQVLPIQRVSRDGDLLLSFGQQRLWFLDQLVPGSSAYNMFAAYELAGRLDVTALERSFNEIIRRHESWRTVFRAVDGQPQQIVLPSLTIKIPVVDLREIASSAERESEHRRQCSAEAQRPFDLDRGPLLRVTLLRLTEDEYVLLLTRHHIVYDGWCRGIIARELSALYEAFSSGRPSSLPELPIQYADFAQWQRQWLQGEVLEAQLAYWKKHLENFPTLELPTDRPRPPVQTSRGARHYFVLSETLSTELKDLSNRHGATVFMTLLAAFLTLLHRYTGQNDIVIGSPIAGRNRSEFENLIGLFLNILLLRTNLSGNPTFRELLAHVREVCLEAYSHQELPFEKLVEELHPERDLSHNPLFQVTFAFQNTPSFPLELAGLTVNELEVIAEISKFDLELFIEEGGSHLQGYVNYNTDLFNADTIIRLISHFQTLLEGIVANQDARIGNLPLLMEAERHQLLVEWNDTKKDYPRDKYVHQLFEEQVERSPEAIAVVFEDQQLTYRELNAHANQLAHYLKKERGVGPEVLVGICVERSLEMVVGLLGILKAGGAYVPLDPSYPHERLDFMLQDTQAPVLLTQQRLMESLPKHDAKILCLDTDWEIISQERETNLPTQGTADNLAYVIYTSGSTGKPKGSLITHYNVTRLFQATHSWVHFDQNDVWTLFHSYAFDFSVWEMWGALLYGGRLVVVPYWVSRSPETFYDLLRKERVTILNQTPSAFTQLVQVEQSSVNPHELALRLVIFGGEALDLHSLKPWFDRHGDRYPQLINMYGITETTVHVTYRPLTATDVSESSASLIGVPIPDLELYVLDQNQNPVPIGVPGELYIGGAGLGRGYLNRPELTAERFIPNPFRHGTGERLYRSGDLARFLSNRDIEYLGRIDTQIKIRGFRIELGEIESVLARHAGVREAVVLAREDDPGDKRLVAYIVPKPESAPTVDDLRSFLKEKLPEYMVPAAFVFLDSLPLTPNGKADRKALPAPDRSRPESEAGYVAPRTGVEELLAEIWAAVLKLDKIGIHDNFFSLGGHSLLATQVVSRIRESFQVEFPLRALFETQTVSGLAGQIEEARRKDQGVEAVPIWKVPRDGELPVSYSQQRSWFLDQLEPESTNYNVPATFRISGPLNLTALESSINEVVRRHEALRTVFSAKDGEPHQTILPPPSLPLTVIDLRELDDHEREAEVRRHAREASRTVFDLARGPLLRTKILRLGTEDHVLLLTMHHIVSDGWSMGVLYRELSVLYEAFSNGQPSPLPDLPIQYTDVAIWQHNWLQGEVLEGQLSYWKTKLEGAPRLQLPTDRPRPPVWSYHGGKRSFVLDKKTTDALTALSRRENVTLFMTLLAAFQLLLHRYTGQEDIVVGSPIAGRTRPEIEGLIGFFVNTLVLRNDFSGNPTFKELLVRVRQVCLDAYTHQDVPFEKLVEELHPERSLSQNPLFQVMFVLQNAPVEALRFGDLVVTPLGVDTEQAKFDLTLSVRDEKEGLRAVLNYSADLFDGSTIDRLAGHFQTLLAGIVTDPERRVAELPILTEAEKHRLLVEWNDTATEYPREKCIHQLFEEQVEKTPDAVAVVLEDRQLTYRQLNARANQLAHYLKKRGVGPEVLVGICMKRSLEMIIALLAILKAGGAYVPLDTEYPEERLAFMLEDIQATVLLTQQRQVERFSERSTRLVCLDRDSEEIDRQPRDNLESQATPDNLAYVIYTSGSTGKPKGVEVPHRGITRLLFGVGYMELDASQTFLHLAPISFDASTFEIWGALLHGARCVLFPGAVASPSELGEVLHKYNISTLWLTASLFNAVIDQSPKALSGVRQLLIGGEALSVSHVRKALSLLPKTQIINGYGPTESTTFTCCYPIPRQLDASITSIPIGRPIANTEVYLLDAHLSPVPIGVAGELHIGGDGLARGYLNRADLTAKKFILDPFSPEPGACLYRTGDLARYLPDGNIEFLGRTDHQVKIRGFRIELGEVEAVIGQHPAISEAVAAAREDKNGDKYLVAYVVPRGTPNARNDQLRENLFSPEIIKTNKRSDAEVLTRNLRSYLKERLPDYMVPSAFVFLDELPRTPNGKLDRRALPAPQPIRPEPDRTCATSSDPLELQLTSIWKKILGVDNIAVGDNFFELGGHSLLAVRLFAEIEKTLGRKRLPLAALFQAPTIERLASLLREEGLSVSWSSLVALQPNGRRPPFFWVHGENSNALLSRYLGPDQPLYGLVHQSQDGKRAVYTSVEDIAAHYLKEVRTVQPQGPYYLGGFCIGGTLAFEMAQQLQRQDQKVALLVLLDATSPGSFRFSPDSPKPLRNITLFREEFYRHVRNLALVRPQEKPTYVLKQVKRGIQAVAERIKKIAKRGAYKVCLSIGYPLPLTLLYLYREDLYHEVIQKYVAQPYAGRVIVFKTGGISRDRQLSWQRIAAGGLEIYEVPGKHTDIVFKEPQIQGLAKQLKVCLDKAQANG
jgi:amino acid adenylation domain-containing protein